MQKIETVLKPEKKYIELAKKLKALADRGVGGEKQNAENMLNALLKKHNISIEDIEGEKIENYYFQLKEHDHDLWHQIVKHVNVEIKCYGPFPAKAVKQFELGGNYMVECTATNYIEIEAKYNFYQRLYEEEHEIFYLAFLGANGLLIDNPNKEYRETDLLKLRRVKEMEDQITVGNFRKQLKGVKL